MNGSDVRMKNFNEPQGKNEPNSKKPPSGSGEGFGHASRKFGVLMEPARQEPESQKKKEDAMAPKILIAKKEKQKPESFINLVDIALDGYDDIFSDFDPSPYSRRTLSIDFITEIERRYNAAKEVDVKLVFSLPKKVRNGKDEMVIKERLKKYFTNKIKEIEEEARQEQKFSLMLIGGGIVFIVLSNLIGAYAAEDSFLLKTLHEITLIPGWVGEFLGVEKLLFSTKKSKEKEKLYKKLLAASYIFVSTEEMVKKMSGSIGQKTEKSGNQDDAAKTRNPQANA